MPAPLPSSFLMRPRTRRTATAWGQAALTGASSWPTLDLSELPSALARRTGARVLEGTAVPWGPLLPLSHPPQEYRVLSSDPLGSRSLDLASPNCTGHSHPLLQSGPDVPKASYLGTQLSLASAELILQVWKAQIGGRINSVNIFA